MLPQLPPRVMRDRRFGIMSASGFHRHVTPLIVSEIHKHAIVTGTCWFMFKAAMNTSVQLGQTWQQYAATLENTVSNLKADNCAEAAAFDAANKSLRAEADKWSRKCNALAEQNRLLKKKVKDHEGFVREMDADENVAPYVVRKAKRVRPRQSSGVASPLADSDGR